jgi:hypothetical protein
MDCVGNPDARECLHQVYAERALNAFEQLIK